MTDRFPPKNLDHDPYGGSAGGDAEPRTCGLGTVPRYSDNSDLQPKSYRLHLDNDLQRNGRTLRRCTLEYVRIEPLQSATMQSASLRLN